MQILIEHTVSKHYFRFRFGPIRHPEYKSVWNL